VGVGLCTLGYNLAVDTGTMAPKQFVRDTFGMAAARLHDDTIYVNKDGPDGNGVIAFYDNSAEDGAVWYWDDSYGGFRSNKTVRAGNHIVSDNNIYMHYGSEGDASLNVYHGGSISGANFTWDSSIQTWVTSHPLKVSGGAAGAVDADSGLFDVFLFGEKIFVGSAADTQYRFPTEDGSANSVMETDGSGNITWTSRVDSSTYAIYAETVNVSQYENLKVVGDFYVHGNIMQESFGNKIDIDRAKWSRDTEYVYAPIETCMVEFLSYKDSSNHVHVSRIYDPRGYSFNNTPYGWKHLMVTTPYAQSDASCEDPNLYASNNGKYWLPYIEIDSVVFPWPDTVDCGKRGIYVGADSVMAEDWTWAYANEDYFDSANLTVVFGDTVVNAIFNRSDFNVDYNSDAEIAFSKEGDLLVLWRETFSDIGWEYGRLRHRFRIAWTTDPTTWSTDSTAVIIDTSDIFMGLSPCFRLDTSGTYEIYFIEGPHTSAVIRDTLKMTDSNNVLVKWESTNYRDSSAWSAVSTGWTSYVIDTVAIPEDTFRVIGGVTLVQIPDSTWMQLWHTELLYRNADQLIMPMVICSVYAVGRNGINWLFESNDAGLTWRAAKDTLLGPVASIGDQGNSHYRGSGIFFHDGDGEYLDWIYPAYQNPDSQAAGDGDWHLYRTKIYFNETDTAYDTTLRKYVENAIAAIGLDSTNVQDSALSTTDINWDWEYVPFTVAYGRGDAVSDSVTLTLPKYEAGIVLFTDSTNQGSDIDSAWAVGTIWFTADSADSIVFCYKSDGGGVIDSIILMGPDRSNGTNRADSVWGAVNLNLSASNWTRTGIAIYEGSITAGDNFAVKFRNTLNTDEDYIKIAWVQMRVLR